MKSIIVSCFFLMVLITKGFPGNPEDFNMHFRLLPQPQKIELLTGEGLMYTELRGLYFKNTDYKPVMNGQLTLLPVTQSQAAGIISLVINPGLSLPSPEGYILEVKGKQVTIEALSQAGLFYGIQTLEQLLEDSQDQQIEIPSCRITDYPEIAYRAVHIDLKHHLDAGHHYYSVIDRLAKIKVNAVIIEFEDKLRYRKAPLVGAANAISIEEFAAISKYAKERNIEISPLVQGLGHASFILKHDAYKKLRDDPSSDWVFDPMNPETYELQFTLYEDAIAATPYGKYLHVGGDEVGKLGKSELSQKSGKSPFELQMYWLKKVTDFALEHDRIPIFWDDMILRAASLYGTTYSARTPAQEVSDLWKKNAPLLDSNLPLFPKGCVYMRWNYDRPLLPGNQMAIDWYKANNLSVMAATIATHYGTMFPRTGQKFQPIKEFCMLTAEKKMDGILCTIWDDASPHFETLWRGIYDFALFSWNYEDIPADKAHATFRQRFYSSALAPVSFDFQDRLEETTFFWETAFLQKGSRGQYPRTFTLIDLPDPGNSGAWSSTYKEKLAKAGSAVVQHAEIARQVAKAQEVSRRNRYSLSLFNVINELQVYSSNLLLMLGQFDQAPVNEQKSQAMRIRKYVDSFSRIRSNFEEEYSKTRILGNPEGYQLDSNYANHLANGDNSTDWMFIFELAMNKKVMEWLSVFGTIIDDPVTETPELRAVRSKLAVLEKAVSEAKAKGIDTRYEEVTIKTAGLFLDTYIPWDMAHPKELASAFSRWGRKEDLKGTPQQEAVRAPVWELEQTSEILDGALAKLSNILMMPSGRRPLPEVNVNHLTVKDGFLNSDGTTVFSGGFIWAPVKIDSAYFGLIGGEVWLPFGNLQSDGTLSDNTITGIISKLNSLQAAGQKGSIGFGQTIPSWAVSRWPDIDDYKGHFFSYDIDHPQVRELWKSFIASLVPAIRDHPAKFDYQLAIEPIWPSVGNWMVNNASPYTFKKYQAWLEDLYGNLNALNVSWTTSYKSFDEINFRPKDNLNTAMWYDWCRFNQWRVTGFFKYISDEIHKYDPSARCHMRISVGGINHLDAGSKSYTGLHNGIDREALVRMYEINGLDNFMQPSSGRVDDQMRYHDQYEENAYSIRWLGHTLLLDFIRSQGPDKLIYDSEWHSVSSVYYVNPEPPAGYMHTALWLSTLHGMGATKTWYWCRNADGSPGRSQEEFYGSLLVQPRLLNEYGVGLAELNAFGKELVALEREPKQIYILYSEPSAIQSVNYINNQMAVYEALQFTGLPAGFVTENELRTTGLPAHCKWLIVADASHISRPALEWFQKYINGGGKTLIIGNSAFKYNEYGKPYNPAETGFLSGAGRLDVVSPEMLLRRIEAEMNKTSVTREIRCTDNSGKLTAFGVMCRSAEFKGGHLVCLINVSSVPKEVSLELNGKVVSRATDLFENSKQKIKSIKMDPLTIRLFQISK